MRLQCINVLLQLVLDCSLIRAFACISAQRHVFASEWSKGIDICVVWFWSSVTLLLVACLFPSVCRRASSFNYIHVNVIDINWSIFEIIGVKSMPLRGKQYCHQQHRYLGRANFCHWNDILASFKIGSWSTVVLSYIIGANAASMMKGKYFKYLTY